MLIDLTVRSKGTHKPELMLLTNQPERPLSCAHCVDDGEDDEAVREEPDEHGHEVQPQLPRHHR